ncbi:hypothetical protein A21D_03915 [Virgibacillus dokdonensis]|uniref:Lipid II flippase Amj n=1 Tax=Virgibacillus dokdonensis TaxID=302167 RepID=A0A2K9J4T3_9BACI|nr:hypothetical protein A21D_03915 [Virgibacillus dokdonensis]
MMQQPFTGSLIDTAPPAYGLQMVEEQYRILIAASTADTVAGIIVFPTFIALFSRAVIHLANEKGSIPALIKKGFSMEFFMRGWKHFRLPKRTDIKEIRFSDIPMKLFLMNMIITAIYTIGVLATLYASLLVPERAATAVMASGLINGIATILLVVFVDPKVSVLADDVVNNRGSYRTLKGVSLMMVTSRLFGTLLAQVLFIPGAKYVAWFTKFIVNDRCLLHGS